MSENPIPISNLNDFVFCPVSIYFHSLDSNTASLSYKDHYQINGTASHEAIDGKRYSDKSNILQTIDVYSEKYGVYGKIDLFDAHIGRLTERKRSVTVIYDGYVFQVYAQCFALREMGFQVNEIRIHSMIDNKNYPIDLPENNPEMLEKFNNIIEDINNFSIEGYVQDNIEKCKKCIYEELCSFSKLKV